MASTINFKKESRFTALDRESYHILIADPIPAARQLLKAEMIGEGYRVHLADSGRGIIDTIGQYRHLDPIDLVVLDLNLPGKGKLALLKQLKQRYPHLPVVIHSFIADYREQRAWPAGIHKVRKGGHSMMELKHTVAGLLDTRPGRRSARQHYLEAS